MLSVEVVYASDKRQVLLALQVAKNSDVAHAIQESGILEQFPELELNNLELGIFSRKTTLNTKVKEGDRIEIYRPLIIDPKSARRVRAERQRQER